MHEPFPFALAYGLGLLAVVLFLAVATLAPKSRRTTLGIIVGEDGRLSSSKFQFFLWTSVVIFSYVVLFVAGVHNTRHRTASSCPAITKDELTTRYAFPATLSWCPIGDIPGNVLLAMGFSLITLATAKGVTSAYVNSGRIAKPPNPGKPSLADLVTQDGSGIPDLSKVQMLVWTLIASATYLYGVVSAVPTFAGAPFPDISGTLMVLMGLGQGAYLGTKLATSQTAKISNLNPARGVSSGGIVKINGVGFGNVPGTVQFGDVVAALAVENGKLQWSDAQVAFVVPPARTSGQPFQSGETVYVVLLLQGETTPSASNPIPFTF
jgi:hypothetical protein